jgi:hypothetical protein
MGVLEPYERDNARCYWVIIGSKLELRSYAIGANF